MGEYRTVSTGDRWTSEEDEGETKIYDQYRCQPHPGLQGKDGEQQLHLSCVNVVDSIWF